MRVATFSGSGSNQVLTATLVPSRTQNGDMGPFILLQDDFSDSASGWEVAQDEYGRTAYEQSGYLVEAYLENKYFWGVASRDFQDIRIDVDVTVLKTLPSGNDAFGVDCRVQTNGDGYGFRISSDGYASIEIFKNGEGANLVEWLESEVINTEGDVNSLAAICQGDHLQFLVNGENVAEAIDDTYSSGDIALSVTPYEAGAVTVLFDDIIVQQLGNPYAYEDRTSVDLTLNNTTGQDVCSVYVTSPENPAWGSNLLGNGETILAGGVKTFTEIPSGSVDILVMTCDHLRLAERYKFDLNSDSGLDLVEPVLIKEYTFTKDEKWTIGDINGGSLAITNGDYYTVSATGDGGVVMGIGPEDRTDVVLTTEVMVVKPGSENSGFSGLVCRADVNGYGIFFAVRGDGQAAIFKLKGGSIEVLQDWTESENINPGLAYNTIEADCVGSNFSMYVNGSFITSVEDNGFTHGAVGLAAVSSAGSPTQADFDYVRLYEP